MIYWVAYQRGSFSLKERYLCPRQAHDRCNRLLSQAHYIRIIKAGETAAELAHCVELPPAQSGQSQ